MNIQRWFRGWRTRKQLSGQNAVKELLSQKKMEKEKDLFSDYTNMQTEVCISGLKKLEFGTAALKFCLQVIAI